MEHIPWTENLNVGVEAIDKQHKVLVNMLNELHQAIAENHGRQVLGTIVYKLSKYVQEHFSYEESMMKLTHYLSQSLHQAEHDAFVDKVLAVEKAMGSGAAVKAEEVWEYLRGWLLQHIQRTDRALGLHLISSGIY